MLPRPLPTSLPLCLCPQLLSVEHLSQHASGVAAGKHSLKYQKREKGAFLFLQNKSNSTVRPGVELCAEEGRSAALSGQVRVAPEAPPSPYPGPEAAAHPGLPPSWCGARLLACFLNSPAPPGPSPPRAAPQSASVFPRSARCGAWGLPGGGGHASWAPACLRLSPGPRPQPQVPVPPSLPLLGVDIPDLRTLPPHTWDFEESDFRTSSMPSLKSHSPWIVTQDSSGAPAAFHSDILSALMPLGGRV